MELLAFWIAFPAMTLADLSFNKLLIVLHLEKKHQQLQQ